MDAVLALAYTSTHEGALMDPSSLKSKLNAFTSHCACTFRLSTGSLCHICHHRCTQPESGAVPSHTPSCSCQWPRTQLSQNQSSDSFLQQSTCARERPTVAATSLYIDLHPNGVAYGCTTSTWQATTCPCEAGDTAYPILYALKGGAPTLRPCEAASLRCKCF